jgi:hypothetical protein
MNKHLILRAAKADEIPAATAGIWTVKKLSLSKEWREGRRIIPPGHYTQLFCYVLAHAMQNPIGDCVMHDTPEELNKHLEFMLRAEGRVLITGLGLGCVVRGCLANPNVKCITVIEKSKDVINLVWPYMPEKRRLSLIHADALEWVRSTRRKFDCAWHDLFANEDFEEPHLQTMHMQLVCEMASKVKKIQGAWEFPRMFRRRMEFAKVI